MRKSEFCNMCENKVSDQLYSNCTTDQCLCFCYMHRTIALLIHVSKLLASVTVQSGQFVSVLPRTSFSHVAAHMPPI